MVVAHQFLLYLWGGVFFFLEGVCRFAWQHGGQLALASVGLLFWVLTHELNNAKRRDALNAQLAEMHDYFWREPVLIDVRRMILVDNEYALAVGAIGRRLLGRSYVGPDDCRIIEKIDRYVNFVIRVDAVTKRCGENQSRFLLWREYPEEKFVKNTGVRDPGLEGKC